MIFVESLQFYWKPHFYILRNPSINSKLPFLLLNEAITKPIDLSPNSTPSNPYEPPSFCCWLCCQLDSDDRWHFPLSVGDLENVWKIDSSIVWRRKVLNVEVAFLLRAFKLKVGIFLDFIHNKINNNVAKRVSLLQSACVDICLNNSSVVFTFLLVCLHIQSQTNHDSANVGLGCEWQIKIWSVVGVVEDDKIHFLNEFRVEIELRGIEKYFTFLGFEIN